MKIKIFALILASVWIIPGIAGTSASSKPLPAKENIYAGLLCGNSLLDGEPPSPELVRQAVGIIKVGSKSNKFYDPISASRVAKAYAYRDRNRGGDCWANIQDEYWAPKNQPK